MELQQLELNMAYRLIGHGPTVLISTTDGSTPNACAVAWVMPASKNPPRFALRIGERHKTYANLMATKTCVINLPSVETLDTVMLCGRKTGNKVDKLGDAKIALEPAKKVAAPRLADCVAWIECELKGSMELDGSNLVLVEAVWVACKKGVMRDDGHMDVLAFPTLHHLGGGLFSVPGRVYDYDD
jgi:flavin reductase (DIM6/NTAB) family NADH-FMN oxidoreductase RutF